MPARATAVNVLLVDDSRADFVLTRELLGELEGANYLLDWAPDYDAGLKAIRDHDICLLDYRLGARSGLEFLRETVDEGCTTPIIFLTGNGNGVLEGQALAAGAADYLVKGQTDSELMWRALRHGLERSRALEAVRERDRLFRAIFDTSMDAVLIANDDGQYVDGNPAALVALGVTKQDLLGKHPWDFMPDGPAQIDLPSWKTFLKNGRQSGETTLLRADGTRRIVEFKNSANIMPNRHLSLLRDITERRHAEGTRKRMAALVDAAEDAIIGEDLDGVIREWNPGAERLYGCSAADAIGRSRMDFVPFDRKDEWHDVDRRIRNGECIRNFETVRQRLDGQRVDISVTVSAVRDDEGTVNGVSTISHDIGENKKLHARLTMSDRMATVGTLAAGVAHEINNPLCAVTVNLEMMNRETARLSEKYGDNEFGELNCELRDAIEASERVRCVVRDLKLFSRPDAELRRRVDVRATIESTLRMVWNEIRHRAILVKDYGDIPAVDANESRLGQVFLNLLINAAQAIAVGSATRNEIRIKTRNVNGRAVVEISDTGAGIAPEILARIFDPFYTTKEVGGGTGLGLSISHNIISELGGEISVESRVGHGTTFRVALPAGVLPDLAREEARAPVAVPGRRGDILVIDDDTLILRAFSRTFAPYHEVTTLTDANEAWSKIVAGARYDVILCDLMMPFMTGMQLHALLVEKFPDAAERMIFTTGGAFTPGAREFLERVPNLHFEKPADSTKLLAAVRTCVDERDARRALSPDAN